MVIKDLKRNMGTCNLEIKPKYRSHIFILNIVSIYIRYDSGTKHGFYY